MFARDYRFDPAHVIFEVAQELGIRLVFCRGGATHFRGFDIPDIIPMPTEPLDHMMRSVEDWPGVITIPHPTALSRGVCGDHAAVGGGA